MSDIVGSDDQTVPNLLRQLVAAVNTLAAAQAQANETLAALAAAQDATNARLDHLVVGLTPFPSEA